MDNSLNWIISAIKNMWIKIKRENDIGNDGKTNRYLYLRANSSVEEA
jgi:hypothetical protein